MAVGDGLSVDGWARDGCRVCATKNVQRRKEKDAKGSKLQKRASPRETGEIRSAIAAPRGTADGGRNVGGGGAPHTRRARRPRYSASSRASSGFSRASSSLCCRFRMALLVVVVFSRWSVRPNS